MSNRMEELLIKMYNNRNDRFYSHLFFQVDRIRDEKIPTMGVGIKEGRIGLYYSNKFLDTLTDHQAITIIKHEALHIVNEHLVRGSGTKEKDKTKHTMENIAMDLAINQYLDNKVIEDIGGVNLKSFRTLLKSRKDDYVLPEKKSFEYYFDLLQKEKDEREKNGEDTEGEGDGSGSGEGKSFREQLEDLGMDDHSSFGEMDALDRAMLEDKIRKAAESARGDGAGTLPGEIEELLKLKKKPQISWQREIRQFIGQGVKSDRKSSRSRRNRRYGITFAGHKKDYRAKILVVLDSSGSMHGDRTDKVLSEIYGIYKANDNLDLDIVECDTQINRVFKYEGKEEFKISGRGGTSMTPGLVYARENKYDGVIFLTDGEFWGEDFESNNQVQSLWVVCQNDSYTSPIGRTVNIK